MKPERQRGPMQTQQEIQTTLNIVCVQKVGPVSESKPQLFVAEAAVLPAAPPSTLVHNKHFVFPNYHPVVFVNVFLKHDPTTTATNTFE